MRGTDTERRHRRPERRESGGFAERLHLLYPPYFDPYRANIRADENAALRLHRHRSQWCLRTEPIAQTICSFPRLGGAYTKYGTCRLDNIVTVVDAPPPASESTVATNLPEKDFEEEDIANLLIQQIEFCTTVLLEQGIGSHSRRTGAHQKHHPYPPAPCRNH